MTTSARIASDHAIRRRWEFRIATTVDAIIGARRRTTMESTRGLRKLEWPSHLLAGAVWIACVSGCGESDVSATGGADSTGNAAASEESECGELSFADLGKFRPGRIRSEITGEIPRPNMCVTMRRSEGRDLCTITYHVSCDEEVEERMGIHVHAVFLDGAFVKFIRWLPDTDPVVHGSTTTGLPRSRPIRDASWLWRALEAEPVSIDEIKADACRTLPEQELDLGLTITVLVLSPFLPRVDVPDPTDEQRARNAELMRRFDANLLELGMTEQEVDAIFDVAPLEVGVVGPSTYKIYGSEESFPLGPSLHFSNVLVLFRDGEAEVIESIGAGDGWREFLGQNYSNFPKAPPIRPPATGGGSKSK